MPKLRPQFAEETAEKRPFFAEEISGSPQALFAQRPQNAESHAGSVPATIYCLALYQLLIDSVDFLYERPQNAERSINLLITLRDL